MPYAGKLADPDFRRERARSAARARNTPDAHIRALVDQAPDLTPEQVSKLRAIVSSATLGTDTGPAAA